MKNTSAFLAFLVVLAMVSCNERTGDSDAFARKHDDAALELYYKYAEDSNLTVAYMGDFFLNGNQIDALMLRADFDDDWIRLKSEFGILPMCSNDTKVISVGFEIDTDFMKEMGLDTITDISQVDENRHNKMNAIIVDKLKEIVNKFPVPDTSQSTNAYADMLAEAIGKTLLNDVLVKNGALPDEQISVPDGLVFADSTMKDARDYGHRGYISAADDSKRTLWLFFYDNQDECDNILTHIKEDILVGKLK